MELTLNNIGNFNNLICFSGCPIILEGKELLNMTRASMEIDLNNLSTVDLNQTQTIQINDEVITSTTDINKTGSKIFYITVATDTISKNLVAQSIVNALNTCPSLNINYDIYQPSDGTNPLPKIMINAKKLGAKYNMTTSSTFTTAQVSFTRTDGTGDTDTSKVLVDIFYNPKSNQQRFGTEGANNTTYLTTLQKTMINGQVSFDLSTVLGTVTNLGKTTEFRMNVYKKNNTIVQQVNSSNVNYIVPGYMVNEGQPYLTTPALNSIAMNVSKGQQNTLYYNKTKLYIYQPWLYLSVYNNLGASNTVNGTYTLLADDINPSTPVNFSFHATGNLTTYKLNLPSLSNSIALLIKIDGIDQAIRYDIIQPLTATGESTRINWYNSYGGVSFFDFTSSKTNEVKLTTGVYDKQTFDYYTTDIKSKTMVYSKDVETTRTIKTHIIPKSALPVLNDLRLSKMAWIENADGKKTVIYVTDVKETEQTVPDLYQVEVQYKLSLEDTF